MKNKKAVEFLGGHVVNLIISVIIIILLVFVGLKIYGLFVNEGSDLDQAKAELLKVKEVSDLTYSSGEPQIIETFFSPAKDWYIRSFSEASGSNLQDLPQGACLDKVGCLCICKSFDCDGPNACIGTDYDLKFFAPHVAKGFRDPILSRPGEKIYYLEHMILGESVYQIHTSINSEGGIVLSPVSR
tara:strand:+ start:84 stop:641 length:558 start_codon:yes stop_codon:yes gene_type:complete